MKALIELVCEYGLGKCSNCGWSLTPENIASGMEDAGLDPQAVETRGGREALDRLTFCCPTYTDEGGCLGYSSEDREKPAYWYSR